MTRGTRTESGGTPTRLAVYTAILGRYDRPNPPVAQTCEGDWILFTDAVDVEAPGWEVRTARMHPGETPKRTATRYKLSPHAVLPRRERTVWIDGSMAVDSPRFVADMHRLLDRHPLRLLPHPHRSCVYAEADAVLRWRRDRVDPAVVQSQMAAYQRLGVPHGAGLLAGGLVAVDQRAPHATAFLDRWLAEVQAWSAREQLALGRLLVEHPGAVRRVPAHLCRHTPSERWACMRERWAEYRRHECAGGAFVATTSSVRAELLSRDRWRAGRLHLSNPWMRIARHGG